MVVVLGFLIKSNLSVLGLDVWIQTIIPGSHFTIDTYRPHINAEQIDVIIAHPEGDLHGGKTTGSSKIESVEEIFAESLAAEVSDLDGIFPFLLDGGSIEDGAFKTLPEVLMSFELGMIAEEPVFGGPDATFWLVDGHDM